MRSFQLYTFDPHVLDHLVDKNHKAPLSSTIKHMMGRIQVPCADQCAHWPEQHCAQTAEWQIEALNKRAPPATGAASASPASPAAAAAAAVTAPTPVESKADSKRPP